MEKKANLQRWGEEDEKKRGKRVDSGGGKDSLRTPPQRRKRSGSRVWKVIGVGFKKLTKKTERTWLTAGQEPLR